MARRDDAWVRAAVARITEGDRDAASVLYERYADNVRRYVHRLLGDPEVAQDVTQTVFVRVLTKAHLYEPRDAPFETWLLRIAHNVALDEVRRRRLEVVRDPLSLDVAAAETNGLGASLRAAFASLPAGQREVVILRIIRGLSAAETAGCLARTVASVNNLQHRGRVNLCRALDADGQGLGHPHAT